MALKQGEMSYCADSKRAIFNKIAINKIVVSENQKPALLTLDFLRNGYKRKYNIKSLKYSIYCEI